MEKASKATDSLPEVNDTELPEEYPDFESRYGAAVADLWMQRRMPCHDTREWLESAAAQLTAMVVEDSGLDAETVRQRLNQYWSRIRENGLRSYAEHLERLG